MKEKYLNLCTDYGFKKVFKDERNSDILKDFLNVVLEPYGEQITEITPMDPETLGDSQTERSSIFDLQCKNQEGSTIVVEVQNNPQKYFTDRILYYLGKLLNTQAERGTWKFRLKKIYIISLVNAPFQKQQDFVGYKHNIQLVDLETKQVWSDRIGLIFLDLTKFTKMGKDLEDKYDKWLYYIKHLHETESSIDEQDGAFKRLLKSAELSRLSKEERMYYKTAQEREWERLAIESYAKELAEEEKQRAIAQAVEEKQQALEQQKRELAQAVKQKEKELAQALEQQKQALEEKERLLNYGMQKTW